jgi:hypothetical protein
MELGLFIFIEMPISDRPSGVGLDIDIVFVQDGRGLANVFPVFLLAQILEQLILPVVFSRLWFIRRGHGVS